MKPIDEMFDLETVNKIKRDANAFDHSLRGECDLIGLIERGLIMVAGQRPSGELEYKISPDGTKALEAAQKDGTLRRAHEDLREKGGVRL